jgi:phage tail sheath protein FI
MSEPSGIASEQVPDRAVVGRVPPRLGATDLNPGDPEWVYANLRRYFIYLEHSIDEGTQWAVFEPNDEPLWSAIRDNVGSFLDREWRTGVLSGTSAEDAFFVRCDRTTMTQTDIDNGRLIVEIGIAPLRPAEFVIFRIGQWTATTEPTPDPDPDPC